MITILNPPRVETDPTGIRRISKLGEAYDSETFTATGEFCRVNVKTGEDLAFIRLLQHGIDYFAPSTGDGILVKAHLLAR